MSNEAIMNNYDMSRTQGSIQISRLTYNIVRNIANLGQTILTAYTNWSAKRETRQQLSALSNAQLTDIGLTRADIDRMLSHPNYR